MIQMAGPVAAVIIPKYEFKFHYLNIFRSSKYLQPVAVRQEKVFERNKNPRIKIFM